jgi:NADPH2 dehydrogenase
LEVVDSVAAAIGDKRTAIRISPYSPFQEMKMDPSDIKETFGGFVKALQERHPNLAYLHVVRSRIGGSTDVVPQGEQEETLDFLVSLVGRFRPCTMFPG